MTFFKVAAIALIVALTVLIGVLPGALQNDQADVALLRAEGFTHIRETGKDVWFVELLGCGHNDVVLWTFSAVNPRGQHVSINVCQGIFKGATVRG